VVVETADPEIMGGNSMRTPLDAILPEPGEGADQFGGQTSQLAPRRQRELRLQPASVAGQINDPRRAAVPTGMKSKAAPVVWQMTHVRLLRPQPAGKGARIRAANRAWIQTKRAVNMLAQAGNPHRVIDQNRGVTSGSRLIHFVQ
jgi:hypothetical protein